MFVKTALYVLFVFWAGCASAFAETSSDVRSMISETPAIGHSSAQQTQQLLWNYNGSTAYLLTQGNSRKFFYKEPGPGLLSTGVKPDTLIFEGKANGDGYQGTAYLYDIHCGKLPYQVSGPILDNYERVVLTGQAPRIGDNCRILGYSTNNLEFTLLKPNEVATAPSKTIEPTATVHVFDGTCRGFPEIPSIGRLVEPEKEISALVEGEGWVSCNVISGSPNEISIMGTCSAGSPCEVKAKLSAKPYEGEAQIVQAYSVKSWKSWKGTCYGEVKHEGDGYFTVGLIDGLGKSNVRCGFDLESVAKKILGECPLRSICSVEARFEKGPEMPLTGQKEMFATIEYVDSVKMDKAAPDDRDSDSVQQPSGDSNPNLDTPLGLCAAAINDPLRQMIIDYFVSGGKHLGGRLNEVKAEIENNYGSFLNVRNDATVEKLDDRTGKIGCAVSYTADLQGLAGAVLAEGATARAQILIRQMAQEGKIINKRVQYTVQKTSGGDFVVWFGLTAESAPRQRIGRCVMAYGNRCLVWGR